jgi:hypothetical protein
MVHWAAMTLDAAPPAERRLPTGSKPVLLYIAGLGRSGSTLLGRMASQLPGFADTGELVLVWDRGISRNERCGCGELFRTCPFWSEVGDRAFGGWDRVDVGRVLELQRRLDRSWYLPQLIVPALSARFRQELDEYCSQYLEPLYAAAAAVSGARVLVDSSKHVSYVLLLRHVPTLDLRIAHIVRDPRGVAFSWKKVGRRPEAEDESGWMPRHPAAVTTAWWLYTNTSFRLAPRLGIPTEVVRYERFVADPASVARRLAELTGTELDEGALSFIDGRRVHLRPSHSVTGNPVRFRTGPVELVSDEAWREQAPLADRLIVTALAATCPSRAVRYPMLGSRRSGELSGRRRRPRELH